MATVAATARARALHWVLKIGSLKKSMAFYEGVLGLKVLRHEEFDSGCEATCNGPYQGAWSKTMIGFGPEKENFALELTYNYGINEYEFGNDLQYIALQQDVAATKAKAEAAGFQVTEESGSSIVIHGCDNYRYKIIPPIAGRKEAFVAVGLRVGNLATATDYWCKLLGLQSFPTPPGLQTDCPSSVVGFSDEQVKLQLIEVKDGQPVNHALSGGRIAFACTAVPPIYKLVLEEGQDDKVLTPPLTLPTPGKADVVVTILADRDGYEICFVEDEAFYDLATPKYDVIDFDARAAKGGDGAPPPKAGKLSHSNKITSVQTEEELDECIATATGTGAVVMLDFSAGWCKNCKQMVGAVEKLAAQYAGKLSVVAVDVDDAVDVADRYDVSKLPYFVLLKGGEKVADYLGNDETALGAKVAAVLSS